ncbi:MAG: hypothetical protein ABL871_18455 [Terricaulis sp.]
MRHLAAVLALTVASLASPAWAQDSPSENDLVVTAPRLNEMIREFVGEVSTAQDDENQIARWDRRICPQIAGLPQRQAQFVADRLSQRARQIGLRPGGPNCRANVLIFVAPDADRFTAALTDRFPEVFDPGVPNMHQQSDEALAQFISSDAPVRWWHVSQTVSADGYLVQNTEPRTRSGDLTGLSVMRTSVVSRMGRTTRQDFNRAILVVDAARAAGVRFDALADYISMATLAQLDPSADTRDVDTVLNLFADRDTGAQLVAGMTTWDVAYLDGLYHARRNAANARRQEADISRRMRTAELDAEYLDEPAQ